MVLLQEPTGVAESSQPEPATAGPQDYLSDEYKLVTSTGLTNERGIVNGWLYLLQTGTQAEQQVASVALKSQALGSWDAVEYIGEQGGVPRCLQILSNPAGASDVRDFAAWLLSQLVSANWSLKHAQTGEWVYMSGDEAIHHAGGIHILAEALKSDSDYLQSHVAWVLARMANNPEMSQDITSTSISHRLLELATAPGSSFDVQIRASWAIAQLAESSSSSRKAIIELHAIQFFAVSLTRLADARDDHDAYTAAVLQVLASLALQKSIAAAGYFKPTDAWHISLVLKSYLPQVRAQAARLVANLALANESFKGQILDSTSCMSSLSTLVHDPSSAVRNQAARTLFTLALPGTAD